VKDLSVLEPAYDDALGVTAAFNKSLLLHANELFKTGFNIQNWSHKAFFNTPESRIEMHLQSSQDQLLRWNGGERFFKSGETIHTENSYKWILGDFQTLLETAGFHGIQHFTDTNNWFSVFWAQA
ncbi:MAG: L-histidine N(alpha)-methyltransferase, partial [Burkholderiaceae bacterium]